MNMSTTFNVNRRTFLTAAAGLGAATLLQIKPRDAFAGEKDITLLTWETYQDDPWIQEYTKKTGVGINAVRSGSIDEMFATVQSGSISPDVIYFDTGTAHRFKNAGLIARFDANQVPNKVNIDATMDWTAKATIDGALYAWPYNWGNQPLMYNADATGGEPQTWDALWDPKYAGKVSLFDDAYVVMQMIALKVKAADPFNLTDAEFEACAEALRTLRPQVNTIARGFDDALTIYASGDAVIGYCQNISIVTKLKSMGKNFAYTFPKEGTPTWIDCAVLTERGQRKEVYDFINETLTPAWQARFIETSGNNGVLSPETAMKAGLSKDVLAKTNILDQTKDGFWQKMVVSKLPEDIDRRVAMWNDFKAGTL
jgi:spermidine/putrescine transport system substrate-binding protein